MVYYLTVGILFGLAAGFSPGPLLALVVSESLEIGISAGIKVALARILTDVPIIGITLLVLTQLSGINHMLGIISLMGGGYVLTMGYCGIRSTGQGSHPTETTPNSLT